MADWHMDSSLHELMTMLCSHFWMQLCHGSACYHLAFHAAVHGHMAHILWTWLLCHGYLTHHLLSWLGFSWAHGSYLVDMARVAWVPDPSLVVMAMLSWAYDSSLADQQLQLLLVLDRASVRNFAHVVGLCVVERFKHFIASISLHAVHCKP